MLALNPESCFELADDILLQAIPELGHYYAFNTVDGDNFKLNFTSYWVLSKIGSGITYSALIDSFSSNFEIDSKVAIEDLNEVMQYAFENKIIKEVKS